MTVLSFHFFILFLFKTFSVRFSLNAKLIWQLAWQFCSAQIPFLSCRIVSLHAGLRGRCLLFALDSKLQESFFFDTAWVVFGY